MGAIANITHYQIIEQLYAGTRTCVYRGICTISQQPAIIKILKNDYPTFSELLQFRNQYTIAKSLNSPNIIQTYDLESYNHSYALIMEDFGGISLHEWMVNQENKLALSEFLEIAISLCNILDILYHHRIIHKDIKPSNILINPTTKQVKLIDFSIASLLPRETQIIQNANTLEGTLAYLSPEQTGRMNRGIDYRSDFYALGVTFYELLTGKLPFISDEPMELVHSHLAKTATPVHLINPHLPLVLSAIVNKLMAKNAEDRYQSALGIRYDLEICLEQLQTTNQIECFPIGERDFSDRFIIPEKLYGREQEVTKLLQSFDRVSAGNSEMVLVAGFSGIGKTAIVNEVHKPIVKQRGYFIKGKFDQLNRNLPFSAFVQAFRNLMGQLLTESDVQIQNWQRKIRQALGENGQVIIDVIPELERIIGQQPAATELFGSAAQNRFNLLFQKFLQLFSQKEHPLVIFLDDLQWADSASLQLIKALMSDCHQDYLLLIGAYRDNEVSPLHPLMLTLDALSKTKAIITLLTLQPLNQLSLNQLVTDTLKCTKNSAFSLSELIHRKTQGNPFFATQFLKSLHQDGMIQFNWEDKCWQCDISQINQQALTDDVVDLMIWQLQKLPASTQEVLKLAACIGNQFDLETLAIVEEKSEIETAINLWSALEKGLILPQSEVYKLYQNHSSVNSQQQLDYKVEPVRVPYKFLHDRVQQAAYALIPHEQKQITHLRIGRLLLQGHSQQQKEEWLFEIVGQFRLGESLITDPAEKLLLAEYNLKASQKAIASTAYTSAFEYATSGLSLLGKSAWENHYSLTLNLYNLAAEAAYLMGNLGSMEEYAAEIIQQAHSLTDTVKITEIKLEAYTNQGQFTLAINMALELLNKLEINVPKQPDLGAIPPAFEAIARQLNGRSTADLLNLPTMTNPTILAAMRILVKIGAAAYACQPELFPLVTLKQVELSLEYGNANTSVIAYVYYGLLLCSVLEDFSTGDEFGQLAIALGDRLNDQEFYGRTLVLAHHYITFCTNHARASLAPLQQAYNRSLEAGDLVFAGFAGFTYNFNSYLTGQPLMELIHSMNIYSSALEQIGQQTALNFMKTCHQSVLNLLGQSANPVILTGEAMDETTMWEAMTAMGDQAGLWLLLINKLYLCFLFGEYSQTLKIAQQIRQYIGGGSGTLTVPLLYFYESLAFLATSGDGEIITANQEIIQKRALSAPMNFQHKFDLVAAEKCRVLGQKAAAIELYDKAIVGAKTHEYLQEEALANELAAKFYLDWGKEKVAAGYMQEAYYCYAKWGAKAKITDLERRYPQLLQPILRQYKISFTPLETLISVTNSATEPSNSSISDALDFASIIKAAQALSSTIQLDQLLQQLTHIILQSSGGDECLLIMPQEGIWQVQAIANLETTELCCQPIESHSHLPLKLIQYVKNTQSVVVIDNLQTDLPVIDAYLLQSYPQSILCLPILNQGHLVAILYLKNQSSAGVFNSDRLTVINFLCTQAAISLENARLYHQSQKTLIEVQEIEQQLQASQNFLQLVIDNIPQSVFWKDTQSVYLGCNRLFAEVAGLNCVQDISGKTDYDLPWKKEESDWYRECDRRIMDSGIPEIGIIETQQQTEGKQTWLETNKVPLQDDNGTIIGILGTYQDISDRKQAEAEKSRLISILEATSDLVGIADINGNNLYLNQAGQKLLQIPASEANKFHISEVTAPAMLSILETEMFPKALRDGIWSGETILLSRSGEEIPASQVLMTHKNAQGEVEFLSTIIRDIRESKRIETEYKRKSDALEQALQELQNTQIQLIQNEKMSALGNLVAGVAHEINNPVGFLNGNIKPALDYISDLFGLLDLVQTKYSQLHPEIQEEIENIDLDFIREDLPKLIASMQEGVNRITDISTSLRTFSRADTDYPVACNIHNGIDSTIMILKHRIKANATRPEITVIKEYGDLPQVQCYAGQLNQVFMNILANAIDALDEASLGRDYKNINNEITIKTALSTDNQQVIIHIQDNGKGMTAEVQQKIFDNLFTTKGVNKGTGLGLAIARQIVVEKHQGQITVNSTPNQGTEFIITLPL